MTSDQIRKHFTQMALPQGLKLGEPEKAERAKIEVMAEIAAQLAEINSQLANASKQLPGLDNLLVGALNIANENFRHALDEGLSIFRDEATKVARLRRIA